MSVNLDFHASVESTMDANDHVEFTMPSQEQMDDLSRVLLKPAAEAYNANPLVRYHDWAHAMKVCSTIKSLYGDITTEEELAAAYHDVIYVPGSPPGYNEELSAVFFEAAFRKVTSQLALQADHLRSAEVAEMIRCTRVAIHLDPKADTILDAVQEAKGFDARFGRSVRRLLDADLSSLAAPWDQFVANQADIIWEQAGRWEQKPDELLTPTNRKKSAQFLRTFLNRPHIYHTDEARAKFELQAWTNIVRWCRENGVPLS